DGQAYLNENLGYEDGSLEDGTDYISIICAAYLAQTTAGSDMTYALLNSGEWHAVNTDGETNSLGIYGDGYESYNGSTGFPEGDVLYCTLTGLQDGYYEVTFKAAENAANGISVNSGSDIAQAYANEETPVDMTVGDKSAGSEEYTTYTFQIKIEDGNLKFGVKNKATGGNWAIAVPVSLTLLAPTDMKCVYLYNVATKKFLSRVNTTDSNGAQSWTAVDPYGIPLEIEFDDNNAATIKYLDSELYIRATNWGHADGNPNNDDSNGAYHPYTFTVKEVEGATSAYGTVYQFTGTYGTFYANADDADHRAAVNGTSTGNEPNITGDDDPTTYWVIVDKDTRDAIKNAWVQEQKDAAAEALGVDDIDAYAAVNAGTDCTDKVSDAALTTSITNWTSSITASEDTNASFAADTYGTELYQAAGTLTQTVTGLNPGVYKVTLQGYKRQGTNEKMWKLGNTYEDLDLSTAYLQANDNQINLKPWYVGATYEEDKTTSDGASDPYRPNWTSEGGPLCDADDSPYTNTLYTIVEAGDGETTGSIVLTICCPEYDTNGWMFVKSLTLTLLDTPNLFLHEDPQIQGTYYGTFSSTTACDLVDGVTASYLTADGVTDEGVDDNGDEWGTLTFTEADAIAANEGYLCMYEGEEGQGTMQFSLPATQDEVTAPEGNLLKAVSEETTGADLDDYAYVLGSENDVVGFYMLSDEGTIAAGKAYADLSSVIEESEETDVKYFKIVIGSEDDSTTTGIEEAVAPVRVSTDAIYDLAGRKVSQPQKGGIYIVGGKKVLY
ncbi:MAG: hypothetical protein LUC33_01685, partial [Prevotellaceae bacterium]|nr:hypothetical protein [Prevotellaceae bacterium]